MAKRTVRGQERPLPALPNVAAASGAWLQRTNRVATSHENGISHLNLNRLVRLGAAHLEDGELDYTEPSHLRCVIMNSKARKLA